MTDLDQSEGTPASAVDDIEPVEPRSWRWAALFVLPYLLLATVWSFSNPPGAAPDEVDHLVKALGSGSFEIGERGPLADPGNPSLIEQRNASITRIYSIPAELSPDRAAYRCFAFKPTVTAACLPDKEAEATGQVDASTPIGAYPPFLYVPIGWSASLASSPTSAILAGRLAVTLFSSILLLVGVRHLIRWLGRPAVVGVVAIMTPMAVYITGVVSISGIELTAAIAVAAVVTVALRRPESVHVPATHWTLAAAGAVLALSRQLGVVALAALIVALLVVTGWKRIRRLLADRQPSLIAAVALLFVSTVMVVAWELTYDHPSLTGSALNPDAVDPFLLRTFPLMQSGIGKFGWLDTPLPGPVIGLWVTIWLVVVGAGALIASRKEFWLIFLALTTTWVLAFGIYASVFFTIQANVQGRQFLPIASVIFLASGAVLVDGLRRFGPVVTTRLFVGLGAAAGLVQAFAIFWNGRRYGVGADGPFYFFPDAQWSPPIGWGIWMLLAIIGGALLGFMIFQCRPRYMVGAREKVVEDVQR